MKIIQSGSCFVVIMMLALVAFCPALSAQESSYDCLIEPSMSVELGSSIRGVADEVLVDRGDLVKQGDVLIRLESAVQRAALALAKARSESTAELASRKASMELAIKLRTRFENLYKDQNVSHQQLEEAQSEASIAESNWHQARENQLLAQLELQQASEVLALRTIKSPISGIVVESMISPGELVTEDRPILRLATIDPLHVEVIMPASAFGRVLSGSIAKVMPSEPISGAYEGRVTIVDNIIDAASGTFGIQVELPNPGEKLPPGLNCEVQFAP